MDMKKLLGSLSICYLFIFNSILANTVIVKGTVQDANKNPIANKKVIIATDSLNSASGCYITHTVLTNSNGIYIDTIKCLGGDIRKLKIAVENCNGTMLINDPNVTNTNIVENNFVVCLQPTPAPNNCKAFITFNITGKTVKFNSVQSNASGPGDSIIKRYWIFGDGLSIQDGNRIDPPHTYTRGGSYTVILYIKTKQGCESKYAVTIQIPNPPCAVQLQFSAERIGTKKVQFNSSLSSAFNDSIVSRTWKFGDNTSLTGNQITPLKEYPIQGAYTVCLKVKTANGCEAEMCKPVILQDSINLPQAPNNFIRIVSINPNPVAYRMILTIWSRNNQTDTEVSIYDIYGQLKKTLVKQLIQGNNVLEINTEFLQKGPYYLKVSCKNGKDSRAFYKL